MKTLLERSKKLVKELEVPSAIDVIQSEEKLKVPEIRVWCHPKEGGDDYYNIFDTFNQALDFIKDNPEEAESVPLIAYNGREINIFEGK